MVAMLLATGVLALSLGRSASLPSGWIALRHDFPPFFALNYDNYVALGATQVDESGRFLYQGFEQINLRTHAPRRFQVFLGQGTKGEPMLVAQWGNGNEVSDRSQAKLGWTPFEGSIIGADGDRIWIQSIFSTRFRLVGTAVLRIGGPPVRLVAKYAKAASMLGLDTFESTSNHLVLWRRNSMRSFPLPTGLTDLGSWVGKFGMPAAFYPETSSERLFRVHVSKSKAFSEEVYPSPKAVPRGWKEGEFGRTKWLQLANGCLAVTLYRKDVPIFSMGVYDPSTRSWHHVPGKAIVASSLGGKFLLVGDVGAKAWELVRVSAGKR